MQLEQVLKDKTLKGKAKVESISEALLAGSLQIAELIDTASALKGSEKGTCVEALEVVSRTDQALCDSTCFRFAVDCLNDKAPRVKWEAAKVIGNLAPLFKPQLEKALPSLLANTEDKGTVVRWSAAYALAAILLCKTKLNANLLPAVEAIVQREENNAVRKIYSAALKKIAKEG